MIDHKTPGAYRRGKGIKKGYHKRINLEEIAALRQEGLPYSEIAARLGVTLAAIRWQQYKRRKQLKESKRPQDGAEGEGESEAKSK